MRGEPRTLSLRKRTDFCRTDKRRGNVISTVAWSSPAFPSFRDKNMSGVYRQKEVEINRSSAQSNKEIANEFKE
jgi:hypothetical protein